jgi:hypothetical protein
MVAVPLVAFAVVRQPAVQRRLPDMAYPAAYKHWGQVLTPGYAYTLLDPEFYDFDRRAALRELTAPHVGRYVVRAFTAYVIVPAPWQIDSTPALAYLPEQIVWYVLAVLAPIGAWMGLRRDVLVTTLLVCHAAIAALMVAFITGNVGTLVRHRGMALPFIVWLSALGAVELGRLVARGAPASPPVLAASKA